MTYNQSTVKEGIRYFIWLSLFSGLLLLSYWTSHIAGKPAISLTLIIATSLVTFRLFNLHFNGRQRLRTVLKALANGDPTLGLSVSDPLIGEFNRVQKQIQSSRLEIEAQHQFLQTMLTHMDTGILVINNANELLHKNPALERLLGVLPKDIKNARWGQLGHFILSAKISSRCVIPWQQGAHTDTLSVRLSASNIQSQSLKIISVQSIYQALQAKEQQAYKNLTKVLTHEIANSIMPLASLADTCKQLLPNTLQFENDENKEDLAEGLTSIAKRASHLDQFIQRFLKTNQLPAPNVSRIDVRNQVEQVLSLFKNDFQTQGITININASQDNFWLMADAGQLQQVLVNLIKNSLDSMSTVKSKKIRISIAYNELTQLIIDIQDSGLGLESQVRDKIFIPFFTTKNKGSGIGLSLSRQIMFNHGGDLLYLDNSRIEDTLPGACFRIVFG